MNGEALFSGLSLAMDAFAVSICVGGVLASRTALLRAAGRLAFACGLFQFFMPLLGGVLGRCSHGGFWERWVPAVDHWAACGLLAFVGLGMIRGALKGDESAGNPADSFKMLFSVALATSLDAFAVGLSFSLVGLPVMELAVDAGLVTGLLCAVGVALGRGVGACMSGRFPLWFEGLGGVVLLIIGARILVTHLQGGF